MTMTGPRSLREFFTGTNIGIIILALALFAVFAALTIATFTLTEVSGSPPVEEKITLTKTQLDEIKADAYTAGHIDGRASVIHEDDYCPLGVPEGYEPSPWPEWRKYATVISNTSNHFGCE